MIPPALFLPWILGISCSDGTKNQAEDPLLGTEEAICEEEEIPAQLRLLSRNEYNASIYSIYYGEGDSCLDTDDCDLSESCLYGVCRPAPCDQHTFIWPHGGSDVWIAGTFNDWEPQPMSQRDGVWVQTLQLDPGEWVYKFVVDGEWVHDWEGDATVDDGFGGLNNTFWLECSDSELILANPSRNFPVESPPAGFGFDNHSSALVSSTHILRYMEVGEALAPSIVSQSGFNINELGAHVFRRELTAEEEARYQALDPEIAVQVMLASASFIYRDETESLSEWRLATALSYFLWGSPPDDYLRGLANSGELSSNLSEVIDVMMDDPRAQKQIQNFAVQWLHVEGVLTIDKGTHDEFDAVRTSIHQEAGEFVANVFFGSGKMDDLLLETVDPVDDIYKTVDAGILGLPAVLASTAHSDQTSPVKRGLFIRESLLCQHFGAPPADAGGVPDVDPSSSTRERFEQHSDDPTCASCHKYIDPIGFGFEHYNEIGVWRDYDGSHPVDASGDMNGIDRMGDETGGEFNSLPELAQMLAGSQRFDECVSEHLMRFAIGREEGSCTAQTLAGNDIRELLKNLLMSDAFLGRVR